MATGRDEGFPEIPPVENLNELVSNPGRVGELIPTGRGPRAVSSPAILELSQDGFRYKNSGNPIVSLKKRLTRSCPHHLSEETPLNSNAESSRYEESEQGNDVEQMEERRNSSCINFWDCCVDSIVQFRNSKLILILQFLIAPIPLSGIVMGVTYADRCKYLPIVCAVVGVMGIVFIGVWIMVTFCKEPETPWLDHQKFFLCFFSLTMMILVIIDMSLVAHKAPSFTKGDKNYCHKTFYEYSVKKEVWTVTAFVVAAIFYLPRSRHYLCCCSCFSSRPTLPNMRYLSIETIE